MVLRKILTRDLDQHLIGILMVSRFTSLDVALRSVLLRYGLMDWNGCNSPQHSSLRRFMFKWFIHSDVSSVLPLWSMLVFQIRDVAGSNPNLKAAELESSIL
jgi:hypothetical protein